MVKLYFFSHKNANEQGGGQNECPKIAADNCRIAMHDNVTPGQKNVSCFWAIDFSKTKK